jgi:hypothetical protein
VRTWNQDHAACRRVRACRLKTSTNYGKVSPRTKRSISLELCFNEFGRQPLWDASCSVREENVASRMAAAVRFRKVLIQIIQKKPAAGFPARARYSCDDESMPVICPTWQDFSDKSARSVSARCRRASSVSAERSTRSLMTGSATPEHVRLKKPAAGFRQRALHFSRR